MDLINNWDKINMTGFQIEASKLSFKQLQSLQIKICEHAIKMYPDTWKTQIKSNERYKFVAQLLKNNQKL